MRLSVGVSGNAKFLEPLGVELFVFGVSVSALETVRKRRLLKKSRRIHFHFHFHFHLLRVLFIVSSIVRPKRVDSFFVSIYCDIVNVARPILFCFVLFNRQEECVAIACIIAMS
jgi:hypothetical protein